MDLWWWCLQKMSHLQRRCFQMLQIGKLESWARTQFLQAITCNKSTQKYGFADLSSNDLICFQLHADLYCPNDTRFVFHLDSDVVLTRLLVIRDVFFRGKAMLQYAPYESLPAAERQWQEGTS